MKDMRDRDKNTFISVRRLYGTSSGHLALTGVQQKLDNSLFDKGRKGTLKASICCSGVRGL
jgi:hypothetical protein